MKKNKVVATIEARMTSSRLPGKVLMTAAGKTMLEHMIDRVKLVKGIDEIIIATTVNLADDEICKLAKKNKVSYYRGSENDVLDRVLKAAQFFEADIIIELTADCPVIDHNIIEQSLNIFKSHKVDYVSNVIIRSYPDGMDTQVFKTETLLAQVS